MSNTILLTLRFNPPFSHPTLFFPCLHSGLTLTDIRILIIRILERSIVIETHIASSRTLATIIIIDEIETMDTSHAPLVVAVHEILNLVDDPTVIALGNLVCGVLIVVEVVSP